MWASKKFSKEKSANDFAKKVNGTVRDLRHQPQAKCKFKVIYLQKKNNKSNDWSPEDDRDFGYPNDYWK